MTAVDVDLEALWDAPAFEVFLTPLLKGEPAFEEQVAYSVDHRGHTAFVASWRGASGWIDGVRIRVGDATNDKPIGTTRVHPSQQLSIIVHPKDLP